MVYVERITRNNNDRKISCSYRLSMNIKEMIREKAEVIGISQGDLIEQAIAKFDIQEAVKPNCIIKDKYAKEIDELLEEMRLEHERDEAEAAIRATTTTGTSVDSGFNYKFPEGEELPF